MKLLDLDCRLMLGVSVCLCVCVLQLLSVHVHSVLYRRTEERAPPMPRMPVGHRPLRETQVLTRSMTSRRVSLRQRISETTRRDCRIAVAYCS